MNRDDFFEIFEKLSKRQKEILEAFYRGKIDSEIAGSLFISKATVRKHISNIVQKFFPDYERLGTSKRPQLTKLLVEFQPFSDNELDIDRSPQETKHGRGQGKQFNTFVNRNNRLPKYVRTIDADSDPKLPKISSLVNA